MITIKRENNKAKYLTFFPLGILLMAALLSTWMSHSSFASGVTGWKAGNIISDAVMTNTTSMSARQIQSFLNKEVPTCDTNGTQLSEYGGPDLNGDGKVQRWEWGKEYYKQTTFTCLKDYKENGLTSAQIIYNAAKKYSVNPQVLIVLLQKEQSLVTDTWPLNIQYKTATGYGCPDTAPCDSQYYGLTNQVNWAATMYNAIMTNSSTWYTPYILGKNYIQYNPDSSCGGSTVDIENRATQALYNYTPYQPNKATLAAGWGTASCGAYGNRNFYLYFNKWFGDPRNPGLTAIENRYNALSLADQNALGSITVSLACTIKNNGCYRSYQHGAILWTSQTGAWESMEPIRDYWAQLGYQDGKMGYPTAASQQVDNDINYQKYQNGYIIGSDDTGYWESKGSIRDYWAQLGYQDGEMGLPTGPEKNLENGGWYQSYQNGYIIGKGPGNYWESMGPIRDYWAQLGYQDGEMGLPKGPIKQTDDGGYYQAYENGYIIGKDTIGYRESKGSIRVRWAELGYQDGKMGYPKGPEKKMPNGGYYQAYENGYIIGKGPGNYWESMGPIRDYWAQLGYQDGKLGLPIGPINDSSGEFSQTYQHGTIYYTSSKGAWVKW